MKIWKYVLELTNEQTKSIPAPNKILDIQEQNGKICMWVLVDETSDLRQERVFNIYGTGQSINEIADAYLGTVQIDGFVWHIFS